MRGEGSGWEGGGARGDGVRPFIDKGMDPEVRKRDDLLTVSGMKMGV